jgi:hypothetical protein
MKALNHGKDIAIETDIIGGDSENPTYYARVQKWWMGEAGVKAVRGSVDYEDGVYNLPQFLGDYCEVETKLRDWLREEGFTLFWE